LKIAGFTFIRNAIKFDFPVIEAITSILPICDEFIVAIGKSEDDTLELIQSIPSDKIRIIKTEWNDSLKGQKGKIFALQTDIAFKNISKDIDWAFYIQSDEVIHEKYLQLIQQEMQKWKNDAEVDGLLFKYKHFFGSYDYVGASLRWYRREIRLIKNKANIYSYKDAQSFRKGKNKKLNVKLIDAYIYHYGYVRNPEYLAKKINLQHSFHESWDINLETFDYLKNADALYLFEDSHPNVMRERIQKMNWDFNYNISSNRFSLKDKFKMIIEKYIGYRIGEFKNYKII